MAKQWGERPSRLLGLTQSAPTRFDFDRAVFLLGSTMEARLKETVETQVPNGEKAPDGYHIERVPRYTLHDLLTDGDALEDGDAPLDTAFAGLATAALL